jgi:hypothetical protein
MVDRMMCLGYEKLKWRAMRLSLTSTLRTLTARYVTSRITPTLAILIACCVLPSARAGAASDTKTSPASEDTSSMEELSKLTFSQLLEVRIITPASLLSTELRRTPGSVTILDQSHIRASGARDLDAPRRASLLRWC